MLDPALEYRSEEQLAKQSRERPLALREIKRAYLLRDEPDNATYGLAFLAKTPRVSLDSNVSANEEARHVVVMELLEKASSVYGLGRRATSSGAVQVEGAAEQLLKHLTCLLEVWRKGGRRVSPEKRSSYVKESKKKEEESDEGALTSEKAMEQSTGL